MKRLETDHLLLLYLVCFFYLFFSFRNSVEKSEVEVALRFV